MSGPDVLERMHAVHVRRAREHRDAVIVVGVTAAVEVRGIKVIHDRVGHLDVDAAELVNQLHKPVQPDPYVVVDVHAEIALDGGGRALRTALLIRPADLAPALVRDLDPQVTRDRQHRRLLGAWIDPDQDHRLRVEPVGRELGVVVGAEEQHGKGLGRGADRVQVREAVIRGGRAHGGLEDRQEIRAQAPEAGEQETEGDNPNSRHECVWSSRGANA